MKGSCKQDLEGEKCYLCKKKRRSVMEKRRQFGETERIGNYQKGIKSRERGKKRL